MTQHKRVEDIMVDVFDFPVVPRWYTIKQAIDVIQKAVPESNVILHPVGILIFDEQYRLVGSLSLKDILKGLEPRFLRPVNAQVPQENEAELAIIWDALTDDQVSALAEAAVSDFMVPAEQYVSPDDPITKAAYLMTRFNLLFLPVIEGNKKLVGVIRMFDVFREIVKMSSPE